MGKDNKIAGCFVMIVGIVFLVICIVAVIALVFSPSGDSCSPALSLRPNEQQICIPGLDYDETWVAEFDEDEEDYIRVYKTTLSSLTTTYRSATWKDFSTTLSREYSQYAMSVPLSASIYDIRISCYGSGCDYTKVFLMDDTVFQNCVDSKGRFDDFWATPVTYLDEGTYDYTSHFSSMVGPDYYHLVFSNDDYYSASITFTMTVSYKVYDTSSLKEVDCEKDGECRFKDMKLDDALIMEYPDVSAGPYWIKTAMHNRDINWSSVIAIIVVFGGLGLICFIAGGVVVFKAVKKIGKKVDKAVNKAVNNSAPVAQPGVVVAPAPAVAVAPAPYPAQPYPAQPYPAQPYPAQPYPAQAGYVDPGYAAQPGYAAAGAPPGAPVAAM